MQDPELQSAVYLGDGLYASHDGYQFRLFAHNGIRTTHEVFLEPGVLGQFFKYVERIKGCAITVKPLMTPEKAVTHEA
jgi:hypothetical protein